MDEELRRIRSEEALADSVYKRFHGEESAQDCPDGQSCTAWDCPYCSYEQ